MCFILFIENILRPAMEEFNKGNQESLLSLAEELYGSKIKNESSPFRKPVKEKKLKIKQVHLQIPPVTLKCLEEFVAWVQKRVLLNWARQDVLILFCEHYIKPRLDEFKEGSREPMLQLIKDLLIPAELQQT